MFKNLKVALALVLVLVFVFSVVSCDKNRSDNKKGQERFLPIVKGYRYVSCEGIKFLGRTKNGVPWDGQMKYPSGETAKLDRKNRTIKFSDGSVYIGDIDVLCRDGNGEMTMEGGGRYVGEWKDDRMEGHGTYYYDGGEGNGDFYDGEFRDGKFHGQGTFSWSNGDIYEGSYANGLMDGYGKFVWANGDTYTGSYSKGVRNGRGRFEKTGDAGCYDGDWVDDKKQGQGVLDYKNGDRYSGSFVNGLPDTRVLDENGAFVVMESGEYKHGAEGIYTWKDGRQYIGYFEEGKVIVQEPGE